MSLDDPPRVTIVIPAWGDYTGVVLDEALASVRSQGVPVEVVLVDNANDPPLERPETVVVRSERRVSLGAARNLGLEAATAPAVMFWDADDLMLDGPLSRMLALLDQDSRLVAVAPTIVDSLTNERHHWPRVWPMALGRMPPLFAALNSVTPLFPVIGAMIRTAVARSTVFPEVDAGDDWVMGVSIAWRGRVALDRRPGRLYRRHDGSLSASWGTPQALRHAKRVRARLRDDDCVPLTLRWLLPLVGLGQHIVLRIFRPVARRTPGRRRAGT